MRVIACLLVMAACNSDYGANLTFSAPSGPVGATSYEIVLASTDLVPVIPDQRVSPLSLSEEAVTYYLQEAAVAGGAVDKVDGFRVLVEADARIDAGAFIPFALFYDDAKALVGIGTYGDGAPAPIVVPRGSVNIYTLHVEPVTDVGDSRPIEASQALRVECARDDGTAFVSGIAWRPASGGEVRMMLPATDDTLDATARALDLDCDGVIVAAAASNDDCDDTHARFHAGAADVCDGEDTNCDGAEYVVEACNALTGACPLSPGHRVCSDVLQPIRGACLADNACACANSTSGCERCFISNEHANGVTTMCLPALDATIGTHGACSGGGCTIEVANARGGWIAQVAPPGSAAFSAIATGIIDNYQLRVTRADATTANPAVTSVGGIDLVYVTAGNGPSVVSFELETLEASAAACAGTGPYAMTCTQ